MKSYVFSTLAVAASIAQAHTTLYALWVNDVDQGLGNTGTGYIRSPPNNNPVKDLTSPDMACNVNNVPAPKYVSVKPGDNVTFEWHHNSRDASDDIIASSHKGPVQVYMAPMTSSQGSGPIWQKIAEHGYDATSKRWAVDDLISNKGKHSIIVPDVADGNYFLRPEIIALHEADTLHDQNSARGAQFYFECAQLKISGGSGSAMPAGVSFPGAYKDSDPGVHFNLYGSFSTYPVPGPTVWSVGAVATSTVLSQASTAAPSSAVAPSGTPVSSSATTSSSSLVEAAPTAASSISSTSSDVAPASASTFANSITASVSSTTTTTVPTTLATSVKPSSAATTAGAPGEDDDGECPEDGDFNPTTSEASPAMPYSATTAAQSAASAADGDDGDDGDCEP